MFASWMKEERVSFQLPAQRSQLGLDQVVVNVPEDLMCTD